MASAAGCAASPAPRPATTADDDPAPALADSPDGAGELIAVPGWVAVLIESAVEIDDEAGLERLAGAASDEIARRMLLELSGEELTEARLSIMTLMIIEWGAVLGEEEAFGSPEFKRQLVLMTIFDLERSLGGKLPHQQLAALRCDLLEVQLADLRRLAFDKASELFRRRLDPQAAAEAGANIRIRLGRVDERSKELAGSCRDGPGGSMALANAWIDAGYLLSGDPCDVLTWDLYMLILGADELLTEAERVLGPGCTPNVLVFH